MPDSTTETTTPEVKAKEPDKKHIIISGVYDFLLKTQLLVSGYIYNF